MASQCLFCSIIAGDIPSRVVYSDDDVYAFHDISPVAPVHILLIPRKHLANAAAARDEDEALLGKLMLRAGQIASSQGLAAGGFRYVVNIGSDGGQTVDHLHLHILGGRQMSWPPG